MIGSFHVASIVRKQRAVGGDAQLPLFLSSVAVNMIFLAQLS